MKRLNDVPPFGTLRVSHWSARFLGFAFHHAAAENECETQVVPDESAINGETRDFSVHIERESGERMPPIRGEDGTFVFRYEVQANEKLVMEVRCQGLRHRMELPSYISIERI